MLNHAGSGTPSASSPRPGLTRPSHLSSRSISQDVYAPRTSRPRTMTADDANVDLVQALSDVSDRSSNHRRIQTTSILPSRGLERGVSANAGLMITPGERARQVAMLMKSLPDNNANSCLDGEPATNFHDLISILEKQRESDNSEIECYISSSGSQRQCSKTEDGQKSSSGGEGKTGKNNSRLLLSSAAASNNNGLSTNNGGWGKYEGFRPSPQRQFSNNTSSNSTSADALHNKPRSNIDHLLDVAQHVAELCKPIPEDEEEVEDDSRNSTSLAKENANFLSQLALSHPDVPPKPLEEETAGVGVMNEETPMLVVGQRKFGGQYLNEVDLVGKQKVTQPVPTSRLRKLLCWWIELRKQMRMLVAAFDGPYVRERLWHFVFENEVPMIIVPALAMAAFFYYKLNNPVLPILPTNTSISWCLLFLLRHYITLQVSHFRGWFLSRCSKSFFVCHYSPTHSVWFSQMAYVAQYLIVDVSAVRSLFSVKLVGPLATLYIINARGWPFIITVWGLLNFCLIHHHPDNEESLFFSHWLYFTEIAMFTVDNPSGSVVESDTYRELLIAFIVVGVATSLKRTVLALYLSKRL